MKKKILGALAALAIALGLTVVVASPAEAHTSGGTYSSVCQTDGTYKLIWTVLADNAPAGETVTVTAISPASLGSSSGPGNQDQKFEQIVPGTTVQPEASFHVEWSDGYVVSPVILKALLLNGTCVDTTSPPPALLCTDITDGSYSAKVDADANDPFYVTIPAGKTLTAYCVKSGTDPVIVTLPVPFVGPGQVQIDHPSKDSVSHYQLQLIDTPPPTDVCDNIDGNQETVPDGLIQVGEDCVEPEPEPQVCSVLSPWGTESDDNAPFLGPDGLVFEGGSGDATGYGVALSGNLQGLPTINYSATGDLDVFYPRIVINSLADGGYAYDSLTVISEGPVTGSSIAASNKRGFVQHTLDEWADLLPNNELVAFFFHLDSGAGADKSVTLSSVDAAPCLSANFVPPVPEGSSREEVIEGEPDCEAGTVTSTTYFYETEPVWNTTTLEYDLVESLVDTEETSREVTLEECPPTPTEPPVDEELPTPSALPSTGQEVTMPLLVGGGLTVLGVLALLFVLRHRKVAPRLI